MTVFEVRAWLGNQLGCEAAELELVTVADNGEGQEYATYRRAGLPTVDVLISGWPSNLAGQERWTVTAFLAPGRRAFLEIVSSRRVNW